MEKTALYTLMEVAKKYSVSSKHVAAILGIKHQTLSSWLDKNILPSSYKARVREVTATLTGLGETGILPVSESALLIYGLVYLSEGGCNGDSNDGETDSDGLSSSSPSK